jgi:hypothetical protein
MDMKKIIVLENKILIKITTSYITWSSINRLSVFRDIVNHRRIINCNF